MTLQPMKMKLPVREENFPLEEGKEEEAPLSSYG